jgi:CHAT domain-containing protein
MNQKSNMNRQAILRSGWKWALFGGCLLVSAFAWYEVREQRRVAPSELLANAYGEQRTMDLRIMNSKHSSVRNNRGKTSSRFDRPESLLDLEAAIASDMRNEPDNIRLIASRGQASLLEWSYEAAISDLQEVLDREPKSTYLLNDLGSAYFERAESEGRFSDFGIAFELQSRALRADPHNHIALFNRAITADRLYLYSQSMEDWKDYLKLDPSGEWAEEARDRLGELTRVAMHRGELANSPLLTFAEFNRNVSRSDPKTWEAVEPRIEEYFSAAVVSWVPAAFPSQYGGAKEARSALQTLAVILNSKHRDVWLGDLLSSQTTSAFREAVAALSQAHKANSANEDYMLAQQEARRAAMLFSQIGNEAGMMGAQYEEVYALHFSDKIPECLAKASGLIPQASKRNYQWIEMQVELEASSCSDSDLSSAENWSLAAYQSANEYSYPSITLRALGFMAAGKNERGRKHEAWNLCREGLRQYWSTSTYPMPGHNLYIFLAQMAEDELSWQLEVAFEEQAITLLPPDETPISLAVEHTRVARAAGLADERPLQQHHLELADHLLDSAPHTSITNNYRLGISIDLAEVSGRSGQTELALKHLLALRPQVSEISNDFLNADYYRALGELETLAGDAKESEQSFATLTGLAEKQRSSLQSEADRGAWAVQSEGSYRKLVEAKLETRDWWNSLAVWEMYRGADLRPNALSRHERDKIPQLGSLINEQRALLERVRAALHNQLVLVYMVSDQGLMIWGYDQNGMVTRLVRKDSADLGMLSRRLGELCASPSSSISSIHRIARQLYKILIDPVADRISPGETLIIESDDALSKVPFQTLMDAEGKYLIEKHPIVYTPALAYLTRVSEEDPPFSPALRPLIVANTLSNEMGDLRPLSNSVAEANDVASRFTNPELITENITIGALKKDLLHAAIFHFAGHASVEADQPGLVLPSKNEAGSKMLLLNAAVLNGLPLVQLRFAVLSACSTETEDYGGSLSQGNLARAFLRSGAKYVLASRWSVDSNSSAVVAHGFYDALFSGRRVPEALATAQVHLQQSNSHPYYWAAFDTLGR